MTYPTTRITPRPWLWRPRSHLVQIIEIHATRGATSPEMQFAATMNWMQSDNNRGRDKFGNPQDWGGSCSVIIGRDGERCEVLNDGQMPTYGAGYGYTAGSWAIDEYGLAVELAQSANQEPYTEEQYESCAEWCAPKVLKYGILPVFVDAKQDGPVPSGFVRHDRCDNGRKLVKTDPGEQWDEGKFLSYLAKHIGGTMSPTAEEWATIVGQVSELVDFRVAQMDLNAKIMVRLEDQDKKIAALEARIAGMADGIAIKDGETVRITRAKIL